MLRTKLTNDVITEIGKRSLVARRAKRETKQRVIDCAIETFEFRFARERHSDEWEDATWAAYKSRHGIGIIGFFVIGAVIQWVVLALLDRLFSDPEFCGELLRMKANG